jgi:hypothetical protein
MRFLGFSALVAGPLVAAAALLLGCVVRVPWSTGSIVMFGCGISYAGLCGLARNAAYAPQPR